MPATQQCAPKFPDDEGRVQRLSLINEGGGNGDKAVRMAHLAALGSHAINGVAALHTELLKTSVLHDFYELTPEKFSNKTNGVTPRRWMVLSNPRMAELLTARVGSVGSATSSGCACGSPRLKMRIFVMSGERSSGTTRRSLRHTFTISWGL